MSSPSDSGIYADVTILLTMTSTFTLSSSTTPTTTQPAALNSLIIGKSTMTTAYVTRSLASLSSGTDQVTPIFSSTSSVVSRNPASSGTSYSTPTPFNFEASPKASNSLTLGLAIGIPIAVISIFALVSLGFFLYQKKKFRVRREHSKPYREELFQQSNKSDRTLAHSSDDKPEVNPPVQYPERKLYPSDSPSNSVYLQKGPDNSIKRQSLRYYFRDRLSKVISLKDPTDEDLESRYIPPQNPSGVGPLSPLFLRRFKLSGNTEPNPDKMSLKLPNKSGTGTVRYPSNLKLLNVVSGNKEEPREDSGNSKMIVIKSYQKRLNDELTVEVGNLVGVVKEYSDGWSKVRLVSGEEGMVPQLCLRQV